MTLTVVFEDGVFKPQGPVDLPEGASMTIIMMERLDAAGRPVPMQDAAPVGALERHGLKIITRVSEDFDAPVPEFENPLE